MTLKIIDADGAVMDLDGTAIGNTIKSWWPEIQGDLTDRGYPGAFLADVTEPPGPVPVPQTTTPAKARLALLAAGKLDAVNAAVASHPDPAVRIYWDYATEIDRNHPYIVTMGAALGLDLDALFVEAGKLP